MTDKNVAIAAALHDKVTKLLSALSLRPGAYIHKTSYELLTINKLALGA
jgi:hypothetical protein